MYWFKLKLRDFTVWVWYKPGTRLIQLTESTMSFYAKNIERSCACIYLCHHFYNFFFFFWNNKNTTYKSFPIYWNHHRANLTIYPRYKYSPDKNVEKNYIHVYYNGLWFGFSSVNFLRERFPFFKLNLASLPLRWIY